jgi:anaerobic magnesium-protoporphyrin IX monomethyl ester cyclase
MAEPKDMKVFLIRGPRYYWPFINECDNYLLPQSLACLAAVLKKADISVKVIDCAPIKMGWGSLRELLDKEKPDIVGVGDSESLYSHEALRIFKLAKELNPGTINIAGGAHFSNLIEETLLNYPVDFIVIGEGEYTLLELVKELQKKKTDLRKIRGIAFKENGQIIRTSPRPLIDNLDELPLPAYALMPMQEYGKSKYLFTPGGATIHHSRGCIDNCDFCVWWVQMAERTIHGGKLQLHPRWRTKSVERTVEEIKLLYYKYKKRFLVFVDDSWNISQKWNQEFAERLCRERIGINWYAFMRADFLLRDEKAGILKKLVDAGLSQVSIGVERAGDSELKSLGKDCYSSDMIRECMGILRRKYPQVIRQVTFIVGIRQESRESLLEQVKYAKQIRADYPAFHPLTPVPGTRIWRQAKQRGWLEIEDFSRYDWITPVMSSEFLSRAEIEYLVYLANKKFISLAWIIRGLLSPYKVKRNLYIWWLLVVLRIFLCSISKFMNPFKVKQYTKLVRPRWYDN